MNLAAIQTALRERNIDAWLFYDHHHRDPIAYRVLGLSPDLMVTRRWFYLVPAEGEPTKLVHKIESRHLDTLPGKKLQYAGWQELFDQVKVLLSSYRDIAMQYSPNNLVFTISLVDGGTLELIRGLGKNVVSSGDLVALFEATWTDEQIKSHFAARDAVDAITAAAFQEIGRRVRNGGTNEHQIQQWFMEAFRRENLVTDDPPIVGVNAHSGDPHYEPRADGSAPIREGDFVLLDVWAKKNIPGAVYYDITWTGFVGKAPSTRMQEVFTVVRDARDAGVKVGSGRHRQRSHYVWMGSGPGNTRSHQEGGLRRLFHSSYRAFDWNRGPFQRRQYGRSGNSRRAAYSAQFLFFDRTRHLLARVWGAQRSQHISAAKSSRGYR